MTRIRIALVAIGVAATLSLLGFVLRGVSERSIKGQMAKELKTVLKADVSALLIWLDDRKENASYFAGDPSITRTVTSLSASSLAGASAPELARSRDARVLESILDPVVLAFGYTDYFVLDPRGHIAASSDDSVIGDNPSAAAQVFFSRMVAGDTVVTPPLNVGTSPATAAAEIMMFVGAPVLSNGAVTGVLAFGIAPERGFSDILSVARSGMSGETFAFDSTGIMLSGSRFEDEMKRIGLLPDEAGVTAVLRIQTRDPQVDLRERAPGEPVSQRQYPLTRMATDAVNRNFDRSLPDSVTIGVDVDGYNDYRGVPVIGAWTMLPTYGFGVTTKVDAAEAFGQLAIMRTILWSVFGLFVVTALVLVGSSWWINRLQASVVEAQEVGQYVLEKKIGEGGMGRVYRARHALLRRPTAVKLLRPDMLNEVSLKRFEREVRHTSALSHPNTVAIYDYGRTPDGVFYYAMEYLPGVDIGELVLVDGAMHQGRIVHVLKQICGALAEAHANGLVHRDIKPSNLMLTVRNVDPEATMNLTSEDVLVGTPLYMAPEAFHNPQEIDARADIYSLGAVMYFMLTGVHAFMADGIAAVVGKHASGRITPVSEARGEPVDSHLEALLVRCLERDANHRPTASELGDELNGLVNVLRWSGADARAWWEANTAKRDKDGVWQIDFAANAPTLSKEPVSTTFHVDFDQRGQSGEQ